MPNDETSPSRPKRERSTRYPGVGLGETIKFCESIDGLGLDGLTAAHIAQALGYKNIKTNAFSARLSAARQFGLLTLNGDGYALTPLAREILHPVDPAELPRLHRQALLKPPLYAELAERLANRRVPDAAILGNLLYHHHQITASAKQAAAEAFLDSARFAGALDDEQIFRVGPPNSPVTASENASPVVRPRPTDVRIDLRLWDADEGKTIRVRAPQTISRASFERFLQAFRLHVQIDDAGGSEQEDKRYR